MGLDEQIRKGLQQLAGEVGPLPTLLAKVKAVDEEAMTCTLLEEVGEDELEIPDVRLRPVLNGNQSITIFPKVDTYALALRVEQGEEWMVVAVDEAEKVRVQVDNTTLELQEGILMQRGDDTLKQILTLIIQACQQILVLQGNNPDYSKLSTALSKVNNVFK